MTAFDPHPCAPGIARFTDEVLALWTSRRDADRRALAAKGLDEKEMRAARLRLGARSVQLRYREVGPPSRALCHWTAEWQWECHGFSSYFRNRPHRRGGPYYERREYTGP